MCREAGISQAAFYAWNARFGGMSVNDAQRLLQLEALLPKHIHAVTAQGLVLKVVCFFLAVSFNYLIR